MSATDVEAALIASLGGGTSPGVDPVGIAERIQEQPESVRAMVESYIERTMDIPLPDAPSLSEIGEFVALRLASEMPELSDIARRKLANYYTYSMAVMARRTTQNIRKVPSGSPSRFVQRTSRW